MERIIDDGKLFGCARGLAPLRMTTRKRVARASGRALAVREGFLSAFRIPEDIHRVFLKLLRVAVTNLSLAKVNPQDHPAVMQKEIDRARLGLLPNF